MSATLTAPAAADTKGAPLQGGMLIAAALLLAVSIWAYRSAHDRATLDPADRDVVAHLGMLEHYDFLTAHGDDLDVAIQSELIRHLAGEMPPGGSGR